MNRAEVQTAAEALTDAYEELRAVVAERDLEIERLKSWINGMRQASTLMETVDGPKVLVPYGFMRDEVDRDDAHKVG